MSTLDDEELAINRDIRHRLVVNDRARAVEVAYKVVGGSGWALDVSTLAFIWCKLFGLLPDRSWWFLLAFMVPNIVVAVCKVFREERIVDFILGRRNNL